MKIIILYGTQWSYVNSPNFTLVIKFYPLIDFDDSNGKR